MEHSNIQLTKQKSVLNKAFFGVIFSLAFSIFAPFYIGIFSLFLYLFSKKSEWIYVFFISFIFLFANMNLHKEIWAFGDYLGVGNDLGWYSTQWFAFNNHPYGYMSIFDSNYVSFINDGFLVQPKLSEPIYHSFSYFLSRLTDGNYVFYTYFITFFIYLPACIVIHKILDSTDADTVLIALVLVFFIFFSMKLTNMFNVIRHYCSGSFLIITLYFIYFDRVKLAIFFGMMASLTHNAAVVVCAIYALTYIVLNNPFIKKDFYKLLGVIVGATCISIAYLAVYYMTFTNYEELQDTGSGLLFKFIDLIIFGLSIVAYRLTKKSAIDKLWFYYVAVIILVLFMHLTSFLQLRYYAYLDYFRWIGLIYIFNFILKSTKFNLLFFIIVLCVCVLFLWLRVYISVFDFDGMLHDYFLFKI